MTKRSYTAMMSSNKPKEAENWAAGIVKMAARLNAELAQAYADRSEAWAENSRLAASYQDDADAVCEVLGVEWTTDNKYPAVALSAAARLRAELNRMRANMQDQSDEVQELWLSPVEAEGLKRQLAKAQMQAATPKEAVLWLWGFYDGNTLTAKPGHEDDIREAWDKLLIAVDSIAGDALLERLATLDAAEAALADCGIGGVFAEFDGLADAIEQMTEYIGDPERCMRQEAERQCSKMAEALLTECRLRREAEQRAERAEALAQLVTPELAVTLDRLAREVNYSRSEEGMPTSGEANDARNLAGQIREALNDKQA